MISKLHKSICIQCKKDKWIVNSKGLCADCVYMNNHGGKTRIEVQKEKQKGKKVKVYELKRTPLKRSQKPLKRSRIKSTPETIERRKETLRLDRELYLYIFNTKPHKCEECRNLLPDIFEDENGNIVCIGQYSHILTKNSFPEYRHNRLNINRLCIIHHNQWEFSDRKSMKIYEPNQLIIQKIKEINM